MARAIVMTAPTTKDDTMFVTLDRLHPGLPFEVPVHHWTPRGTSLPLKGAICLLAFDERGDVWVPNWVGSYT